ncbi:Metastasis-associated protein MTA1, partial [Eschrichtius robustus]|nr:Metastasis-associated protein MTA1 [Eschrichtius robustus]
MSRGSALSVCYKPGSGADNGEEGETEEEMENPEMADLPEKLKHQLRHRELFLSRQLESLPATHIRGKCSVTLLNETESLKSYLEREDFFFYSLVYDPQQKTLLADKGEIRVGNRYQADITDLLKEGEEDGRDQSKLETKVWEARNPLVDKQIDQFLVVARSVGTFARALDCSSSVRQPSLHMSAAAASRDITLFHAMDTLHRSVYDVAKAIAALVPQGGPVLCRDEMEEWSASEASLFEEALEKYGKDFTDIQQDFLLVVAGDAALGLGLRSRGDRPQQLSLLSGCPGVLDCKTHPRPPKPDPVKSVSGVLSGLTPAKSAPVINNGSPTILGKRSYEQHNGVDGNVKKRLLMPSRDRSAAPRAPSSPTRCLLPWGLRLAGRPSFRAQRRSVDCPRSGSPGAPAARLYCLPSCCDCPHAASLSLCGRLRCACNPARAPAPVGGCGTLVPSGGRWDRAVAWGRHGWVGVGEARVDVRSGQGPAGRRTQG